MTTSSVIRRHANADVAGKIGGMICHGTCRMLWTRHTDGTLLADGKTWTGVRDSEEEMMHAALCTTVNAYSIETKAKKNPNTTIACAAPFAIRDGRMTTGQQQHGTRLFSDLLTEALSEQRKDRASDLLHDAQ
jgi:putative intracellular protease/amidase